MLARIRTALASGPAPQPPQPDWGAPVHPPLPQTELAETFASNFQRIGGEFFYCETLVQLGGELRAWLAERLPEEIGDDYVPGQTVEFVLRLR